RAVPGSRSCATSRAFRPAAGGVRPWSRCPGRESRRAPAASALRRYASPGWRCDACDESSEEAIRPVGCKVDGWRLAGDQVADQAGRGGRLRQAQVAVAECIEDVRVAAGAAD